MLNLNLMFFYFNILEVGSGLVSEFDGSASKLVEAANSSAAKLVQLLTKHFKCFRDEADLKDGTRLDYLLHNKYKIYNLFLNNVLILLT